MLRRVLFPRRPLLLRPLQHSNYRLSMSAELPTANGALPSSSKRAHSTSPPPPAATLPADKRIRLEVEEPVSQPPNLVEKVVPAVEASSSSAPSIAAVETPSASTSTAPPAKGSNGAVQGKGKGKTRKVKGRKIKPPKPGGAEEAAAFDIVEHLGAERVKELERRVEEDGWDAYKEAVAEWGKDKEGKDIEVRIAGISDHGASLFGFLYSLFDERESLTSFVR
jgi:tRNA (uracil-5-)-methyltransferase